MDLSPRLSVAAVDDLTDLRRKFHPKGPGSGG